MDDRVNLVSADASCDIRVQPDVPLEDGNVGSILVATVLQGAQIVEFVENNNPVVVGVCTRQCMSQPGSTIWSEAGYGECKEGRTLHEATPAGNHDVVNISKGFEDSNTLMNGLSLGLLQLR